MPAEYAQTATGEVAEGGASGTAPVQLAGRYDATPRAVDDGDMVTVACDAAGNIILASGSSTMTIVGSDAEDAAVTVAPVHVGGRYDLTPRVLDDGDAGGFALDAAGKALVVESSAAAILADTTAILADTANIDTNITAILADTAAIDTATAGILVDTTAILADTANIDTNITAILADTAAIQTAVETLDNIVQGEDDAAVTTPALMAGRYDLTPRTLDSGDGGAFALDAAGKTLVVETSAAAILADTTAILADTANIDTNITAILADTAAIDTATAGILVDTTAILADTANIDTNITAILVDTAAIDTATAGILVDTTAILADTANIDTNITAILVDTAAIQTAVEVIDNLVLAEDAVHGSGDPGVQVLAVRNDELAALAGTDGDYAPHQVDADGALYVVHTTIGLTSAAGVQATATSTEIVAAPGAGKAFVILGAALQQNAATPTGPQLVALEEGTSGTERANFRLGAVDGAGAVLPFPVALAANQGINLDSDQAYSFAYTISYRVIDI